METKLTKLIGWSEKAAEYDTTRVQFVADDAGTVVAALEAHEDAAFDGLPTFQVGRY